MNIAATVSLSATLVGLLFAYLTHRFSSAPGWSELRWFAWCATLAALYGCCNVPVTLEVSPEVITWGSRVSLLLGGLHALAWFNYVAAQDARPMSRLERGFVVVGLCFAALAPVPGALITDQVGTHSFANTVYRDAIPTALGTACFIFYSLGLAVLAAGQWRRWRRKRPAALAHFVGLSIFLLAGLCDSLAAARVLDLPYLLDVGFLCVVVAVGGAVTRRFVAGAKQLEQLSSRLERAVEERTEALSHAQQALVQSEKLAAIGRLSAGVAHEINNPSAVVVANLGYVREQVERSGKLPGDGQECLNESLRAMERISRIVRQLLDAGRTAARKDAAFASCNLAEAARTAAVTAGPALANEVTLTVNIPADLNVLGETHLLEQVLGNLLVNAAQAIVDSGKRGKVELTAHRQRGWVCAQVTDDGPGIPEAVRGRVFEPFFTTKAPGKGTGLGLAVSLGLVRALGGDLSVQSTSPAGTCMTLLLPWAPAPAQPPVLPTPPPGPRRRLLLVDDDPSVLEALRRALSAQFEVEVAGGVAAALERAGRPGDGPEVVLCDLMMPDGGGPRLFQELSRLAPKLASRTLFVTGGATSEACRAFVEAQRGRVLQKPLDLEALNTLVEQVLKC
ncbi:MAG: sensor histidine kinase [Myxococcaceae bacterium]